MEVLDILLLIWIVLAAALVLSSRFWSRRLARRQLARLRAARAADSEPEGQARGQLGRRSQLTAEEERWYYLKWNLRAKILAWVLLLPAFIWVLLRHRPQL